MTADSPLTRPIHSSGERVAAVGLGTWQTFDVAPSDYAAPKEVLDRFVAQGGAVVDSSPMYGRCEQVVGDLARELDLHGRLFLATKVWATGRTGGAQQIEASFRKLGTERIDLLQVHNLVDAQTHLRTLSELKAAARIRYVGVTHYSADAHDALARVLETERVDFVQVNYSVAEREAERRLLPSALANGVSVIVNRPFAEGNLLRRLHGRPLPRWANDIGCPTWAQALLKFVLAHPAVTCVVPATRNPVHVDDNMAVLYGPLPDSRLRKRIAADAG